MIVGVGSVDQFRCEIDRRLFLPILKQRKRSLVFSMTQCHLASISQQSAQLDDRLGRHYASAFRRFDCFFHQRQSPSVSGYKRQFPLFEAEQYPVQHIPRFFCRDCIRSVAKHESQLDLLQSDCLSFNLRRGRKLINRQTVQTKERRARLNGADIFFHIQLQLRRIHRLDDGAQRLRRQRDVAGIFNGCADFGGNRYVQVSGGQYQVVLPSSQQNVGQNRESRSAGHDVLDCLQPANQLFFGN